MAFQTPILYLKKMLPKEFRRAILRRYYGLKGKLGGDTSQFGEASVLRGYVNDRFPHYIVDVGAYDGRIFSVSYPFIRQGWKAILIEPHPTIYHLLSQLHSDNRNVKCINVACSDDAGILPLYIGTDGTTGQEATLCRDDNELFNGRRGAETIAVPVKTLTSILLEAGAPGALGILTIDAEGMDYEVLCGLDFDRFQPRAILTEDYPLNIEKHMAKQQLLESHQYRLETTLGCNSLWLKAVTVD